MNIYKKYMKKKKMEEKRIEEKKFKQILKRNTKNFLRKR